MRVVQDSVWAKANFIHTSIDVVNVTNLHLMFLYIQITAALACLRREAKGCR